MREKGEDFLTVEQRSVCLRLIGIPKSSRHQEDKSSARGKGHVARALIGGRASAGPCRARLRRAGRNVGSGVPVKARGDLASESQTRTERLPLLRRKSVGRRTDAPSPAECVCVSRAPERGTTGRRGRGGTAMRRERAARRSSSFPPDGFKISLEAETTKTVRCSDPPHLLRFHRAPPRRTAHVIAIIKHTTRSVAITRSGAIYCIFFTLHVMRSTSLPTKRRPNFKWL